MTGRPSIPASTDFPNNSLVDEKPQPRPDGDTSPVLSPSVEVSPEEKLLNELKRRDNEWRHCCAVVDAFLKENHFFALHGQIKFRSAELTAEFIRLCHERAAAGQELQDAMGELARLKIGETHG